MDGVCPVTLTCIAARSYWQCHQAVGDLLFQVKMLKTKGRIVYSENVRCNALCFLDNSPGWSSGSARNSGTDVQSSIPRAATEAD